MTRVGALWIGGLEPYMDEKFLTNAMLALGQEGVVSIKVMTNRYTGEPAGYGFINFESDQRAILTMHRLGGKIIPNSNPPIRFKLNHNSTRLLPGEPDTSIWVGDLTPEVDDFALYQFFTQRFSTVRCAKVVLDETGYSKGYGFVRFGAESEQQQALANMTGEHGLGTKPIKVSMANQKNRAGGGVGGGGGGGGAMSQNGGPRHPGGPQNGPGGWGGQLDTPGSETTWPPSQHGWAHAPGGQGGSGATGGGSAPGGQPLAQADYQAYHQYYQQYAQQVSQAQQQQYVAAAWQAWQQHQPQNPQPQ